jgi:hypothetical protein
LIFRTKPYMDVNKALYSEWPCLIEVLDFILLQKGKRVKRNLGEKKTRREIKAQKAVK